MVEGKKDGVYQDRRYLFVICECLRVCVCVSAIVQVLNKHSYLYLQIVQPSALLVTLPLAKISIAQCLAIGKSKDSSGRL